MQNNDIFLKDYQPSNVAVEAVTLDVALYETHAVVNSELTLRQVGAGALCLLGDALTLEAISLDGEPLADNAYAVTADALTLETWPETCKLSITTRIYPDKNTLLSGLYRSNDLFCTQCEAEGFRRITYYPDRPDVLSVFTVTISADKAKYPILLSNGNRINAGDSEESRHWVTWHDPFKKPSYLFALVAGDLDCLTDTFTTRSGRRIDLQIYVEKGNVPKCHHAMASLKKAMTWDEEAYGREYDLDIFMVVAVSDFNAGAMENKGLNIFNDSALLVSPETATDQDFHWVERVVAHEYFHNWTGNRVTCRDWFQLSLKEGLTVFREQSFVADMHSHALSRIEDVKGLRLSQFPEDAGQMAHPVQPNSYQSIDNFYTATVYEKGAEVIRMQHVLLGKAGFRRGMDLYFERHDGQAVTIEDFVAAMEDANDVDFSQLKRWYHQAGTPQVAIETAFSDGKLSLTFTQTCKPTPDGSPKEPFHMPISLALWEREAPHTLLEEQVISLTEASQTIHFDGFSGEPIVSLLRHYSAPVILQHAQSTDDLDILMRVETDGFARWEAGQTLLRRCLVASYETGLATEMLQRLLNAYDAVLRDDALEGAFRAFMLSPPAFEDISMIQAGLDVSKAVKTCDDVHKAVAEHLVNVARDIYARLWPMEGGGDSPEAYHNRTLRNVCLDLMMVADPEGTLDVCQTQFSHAQTMTDKLKALDLLANCPDTNARETALQQFCDQWSNNPLVLDKWFAVQARCKLPGTLKAVSSLMSHPGFSLKTPNRVYALVRTFTARNPRHFHAIDGSGYQFLHDTLLALDKVNALLAGRIATPFAGLEAVDPPRQKLMKETLASLLKHDLSTDLREVIEKSASAG